MQPCRLYKCRQGEVDLYTQKLRYCVPKLRSIGFNWVEEEEVYAKLKCMKSSRIGISSKMVKIDGYGCTTTMLAHYIA